MEVLLKGLCRFLIIKVNEMHLQDKNNDDE
jgi:hypothetical protein